MQHLKQDLEETKKVILVRHQRLHTDTIPPDKPHYLDSGNNYSVIASPTHIDTDTSIIPSHWRERVDSSWLLQELDYYKAWMLFMCRTQ